MAGEGNVLFFSFIIRNHTHRHLFGLPCVQFKKCGIPSKVAKSKHFSTPRHRFFRDVFLVYGTE